MGNDSITAFRTREQLRRFLGIFSPRFSKPKLEFLGQMLFGVQAARDTLVSEVARSLQEGILSKKTQERLERHLRADGLDDKVHGSLLCDAAPSIHDDTFIVIDPTDVQKPYAERMPYLANFAAAWFGRKARLEALAHHVAKVSRKMFEAPEFFCYAIADGLRWLFVRHGRWRGLDCAREERGDLQMEFELRTGWSAAKRSSGCRSPL